MIEMLLMLLLIGFGGLVLLGVALAVVGLMISATLSLAGFLLFKVAPLVLLGWVVLKLVQRSAHRRRITAADERWLDS